MRINCTMWQNLSATKIYNTKSLKGGKKKKDYDLGNCANEWGTYCHFDLDYLFYINIQMLVEKNSLGKQRHCLFMSQRAGMCTTPHNKCSFSLWNKDENCLPTNKIQIPYTRCSSPVKWSPFEQTSSLHINTLWELGFGYC